MKKLFIVMSIMVGLALPAAAQEICNGGTEKTVDQGEPFGFCWDKNTEPDVVSYRLYKDGVVMDTILHSTCGAIICTTGEIYSESVIGTYLFTLDAFDGSFASEQTDPLTLTVINAPPAMPTGYKIIE